MSWMFGNDEDNNPRRPDYRAPRGSDNDNGKSSSGCAVLIVVMLGAVAAVVTAVTLTVQGMIG